MKRNGIKSHFFFYLSPRPTDCAPIGGYLSFNRWLSNPKASRKPAEQIKKNPKIKRKGLDRPGRVWYSKYIR